MGPMNKICFIIQSPSLFSYLNHSLTAQESDLPFFTRERYKNAWSEVMTIICNKKEVGENRCVEQSNDNRNLVIILILVNNKI